MVSIDEESKNEGGSNGNYEGPSRGQAHIKQQHGTANFKAPTKEESKRLV